MQSELFGCISQATLCLIIPAQRKTVHVICASDQISRFGTYHVYQTYHTYQTCLSGQRKQGGQSVFPAWKGSRWTGCVPWYPCTDARFQAGQNQQLPSSCNSLPTPYSPEDVTFTTSTITIIAAELNLQVLRTIYKLINCFSFMTPQRRQKNWSSITQPKKGSWQNQRYRPNMINPR